MSASELTDNAPIKGDVGERGEAHPTRVGGGEAGGLRPEFGGLRGSVSDTGGLIGLVGCCFVADAVFFLITLGGVQ